MGVATCYRNYLEGSGSGVLGSPPLGPSVTKRCSMKDLFTEQEEWRPVVGGEDRYEVSSAGRVRSLLRRPARLLKLRVDMKGYCYVDLYVAKTNSKRSRVHRMVLLSFVGVPPTAKHECGHRNGVRADNRLQNLKWCTRSENLKDRHTHARMSGNVAGNISKLSTEQVVDIKKRIANGESPLAISRDFNMHHSTFYLIRNGSIWGWLKTP